MQVNSRPRPAGSAPGSSPAASRSAGTNAVRTGTGPADAPQAGDTYGLVDVKAGRHPPQDGRVQVLGTVGGPHDDHLTHTHTQSSQSCGHRRTNPWRARTWQ